MEIDAPGPSIIPVTSSISSSLVWTRMPSGGLFSSSLSSRMTRRNTAGETLWSCGAISSCRRNNAFIAYHIFFNTLYKRRWWFLCGRWTWSETGSGGVSIGLLKSTWTRHVDHLFQIDPNTLLQALKVKVFLKPDCAFLPTGRVLFHVRWPGRANGSCVALLRLLWKSWWRLPMDWYTT